MEHQQAQPEWLTLADCAAELRVDVEIVRRWCLAWERGDDAGLQSEHFGVAPADKAKKLNRRIHRDDWKAFKARRSRRQAAAEREIRSSFEVVPRERPTRREKQLRRAKAGAGKVRQ